MRWFAPYKARHIVVPPFGSPLPYTLALTRFRYDEILNKTSHAGGKGFRYGGTRKLYQDVKGVSIYQKAMSTYHGPRIFNISPPHHGILTPVFIFLTRMSVSQSSSKRKKSRYSIIGDADVAECG